MRDGRDSPYSGMQDIALAAQGSNVDIVARVLAIVSVVIALAGVVLAWYQWRNSGPVLAADIEYVVGKERAGHPGERWTLQSISGIRGGCQLLLKA
jgi:hypothetical protein